MVIKTKFLMIPKYFCVRFRPPSCILCMECIRFTEFVLHQQLVYLRSIDRKALFFVSDSLQQRPLTLRVVQIRVVGLVLRRHVPVLLVDQSGVGAVEALRREPFYICLKEGRYQYGGYMLC